MQPGFVLFAAPHFDGEDREWMIAQAKRYIDENQYTQDDVRIVDTEGLILVKKK